MRHSVLLISWLTALLLGWLIVPDVVLAHEGQGFHPESLWALLRTGLLVAAVIFGVGGMLWAYDYLKSRKAR